mmetsp:Transcript_12088/g.13602  ORF Transcript_12088/g.13602 Transcript_12088/m.13602 type:complete len:139 (-) Transcript_12088:390-806(-)
MLSGFPPFEGIEEEEIIKKITNLDYSFEDTIWDSISENVKDLISKLLQEEKMRITPKEALKHKWLKVSKNAALPRGNTLLIERLVRFQTTGRLRKAILSYLASKASDQDLKDEIELFNMIDTNKDGYITKKELKTGLK